MGVGVVDVVSVEDEDPGLLERLPDAAGLVKVAKMRREFVHIRYAKHVVDELMGIVFDVRRRTCNHLLFNALKRTGASAAFMDLFREVLTHSWLGTAEPGPTAQA